MRSYSLDPHPSISVVREAIVAEVIAISALKASTEFTKLLSSLIIIVGYAIVFYDLNFKNNTGGYSM